MGRKRRQAAENGLIGWANGIQNGANGGCPPQTAKRKSQISGLQPGNLALKIKSDIFNLP